MEPIQAASPTVPAAGAAAPHDWHSAGLYFDYRQAANPVRPGLTEPIRYRRWGPELHGHGPTAVLPLDLSAALGCEGPATSPGLAAHFLRLLPGEGLKAAAAATSSLFYVLRGAGQLERPGDALGAPLSLSWAQGDLFVLPAGADPLLQASEESVLYWVHDAPLLHYLGVQPSVPRFTAVHYPAAGQEEALQRLLADPSAARSNRLSILLAHADLPATRTVTHTLWAMLGVVPDGVTQPPHRHQSVALDLIIDCDPGCYSLVGTELGPDGAILNPTRIDWEPGGAFITPPGHWHAHGNESGRMARLLPIQDAGLHTHLRSLDIRFSSGLGGEG
ncbi:cupin [Cyanobium gracile UHCC 0139]|uniref:Cupin n=1 Tax=Cyanobium gracile UHCC 0139 TaxID=3110308 RepID=A0ABU5RSL1_9CYAN|nr:cupin [Cyanobium gracile]MEA5390740.1 cupin [Cyanobium gracile UHCC 0139]